MKHKLGARLAAIGLLAAATALGAPFGSGAI